VYKGLFRDEVEATLFITAFVAEISAGLYLLSRFGTTYNMGGDTFAHLYIPRVVIDNGENSGFAQLGTVWLPLYHILLIPLVAVDWLYTTGMAGTILNALLTACISCLVYRFVREFGGSRWQGVFASLLFVLTPFSLMVVGCSAWMMPLGVFFALLSTYYFKQYLEGDDMKAFMKCAASVIAGTLSRYEVWPVAILIAVIFALRELVKRRPHRVVYVNFLFWGIAYWLFYNLAIFRDPLIWIHGPFPGAYGYYSDVMKGIVVPPISRLPAIASLSTQLLTTIMGYVWILLPLALVVLLLRRDWNALIVLVLLNVHLANALSVEVGGLRPYNLLPGAIIAALSLLRPLAQRGNPRNGLFKAFAVALCLAMLALWAVALPVMWGYAVPERYYPPSYYQLREDTRALYDVVKEGLARGDYVLVSGAGSTSPSRLLSLFCGVSPSKIIDEYDGKLFANASKEPWRYCGYVVVDKMNAEEMKELLEAQNKYYGAHFLSLYYLNSSWREEFLKRYELVLETSSFMLFKLSDHERSLRKYKNLWMITYV
jgi:hypothetical protein